MEQPINVPGQKRKIYSIHSMSFATFVGGPLATAYLLAENFKTFGPQDQVMPTWIIATILTVVLFGGILMVPNAEKIPNQLIPLINALIAYFVVTRTQGEKIKAHIAEAGAVFSHWRALGISLLAALGTLLIILVMIVASTYESD